MRILLVTHYYAEHRGGVELVAGELARRLAARGHAITWAASGPCEAPPLAGLTPLPMRAWNVTERRLGVPFPLWSPGSVRDLTRAVDAAELVHLHDCLYPGNVAAAWRAARRGRPLVVTQHIGPVPFANPVLRAAQAVAYRQIGRRVLAAADRVAFIGEKARSYFAPRVAFRAPPVVIPNGVDTGRFIPLDESARHARRRALGWADDRPVLLFVGRFVEKKGLRHIRRLAEALPDARWVLVGWGPEEPDRWGLANVEVAGRKSPDEVAAYYRAADALVLLSVGEGFPLVVQEALACGTPAVISDDTAQGAPGIEEVATVVPLADAAYIDPIAALLRDRAALAARRPAAAAYARRLWDWDRTVEQYEALFREVLAERAAS